MRPTETVRPRNAEVPVGNARPPIIPPLVERHVGDAAFYWAQHDGSAHSPLVDLAELARFDRLLDAHLDGIRAAGEAGWRLALAALARWRGPGEAFVCAVLAFGAQDPGARLAATWAVVAAAPERMLRGLVSALLWVPAHEAAPWVHHWCHPGVPEALQVAAWRAIVRTGPVPGEAPPVARLADLLAHPDPRLRATACRAAPRLGLGEAVRPLLDDPHPAVIAEAAIALAQTGDAAAASPLWQSAWRLAGELGRLGGVDRTRARHRLARWIRHLGLVAPLGHPGIARLIDALPVRLGLIFALHHGDPALLPRVCEHLDDPGAARLAGWTWSALTGRPLGADGLASHGAEERPTDRLDPGLPLPDAPAVRALNIELPPGGACLLGAPVSAARLPALLCEAPQALRWIAAQRLATRGGPAFDTRAHARLQYATLAILSES